MQLKIDHWSSGNGVGLPNLTRLGQDVLTFRDVIMIQLCRAEHEALFGIVLAPTQLLLGLSSLSKDLS